MKIKIKSEVLNLRKSTNVYLSENIEAFSLSKSDELYSSPNRKVKIATLNGILKHIGRDISKGSIEYLKACIIGWK